ncbi:zinc-dependent alcohol dehydrogenase [Arthrobacter luteolus]|uniref:zinc-dependent alcohol dehydrogenase n=1 Tax=Arthrobacter luteolus TaxID=98672 RepID=UPI0009FA5C32|nr:alcohol dehydrogenase catalytic domain-containing protein [Arthrobacter luteolus]
MTQHSLPAASRQVVFPRPGEMELVKTELPPPGKDEVLVRIHRVGVCATDLHLLAGHIGDPFPLVPGHEFVGEVAALGEDAARTRPLAVGDRVAVEMLVPCRTCERCREGRYNLCEQDDPGPGKPGGRQLGVNIPQTVLPGLWGGYSEYLMAPGEAIIHVLPEDLDWDIAALVEPLAVAYRCLARGRVEPGNRVVVIGPGPVGLLATAAARAAGANVMLIGTRDERLRHAIAFGASAAVNSRLEDPAAAVQSHFGGLADVVIEIAGVPAAQQLAVSLVRRGGRVVLAGACGSNAPVTFLADEELLTREIDILPSFLSAGGYEPSVELLSRGGFPFADLISHSFPLEDAAEAFRVIEAREGNVLKVLLDPTSIPVSNERQVHAQGLY